MSETPAEPPPRAVARPRRRQLGRGWPRGLVRLIVICMVVGLALSIIGVGPGDFWNAIWSVARGLYDWLVGIAGRLVAYVIIGACVVVPILVARALWRRANR